MPVHSAETRGQQAPTCHTSAAPIFLAFLLRQNSVLRRRAPKQSHWVGEPSVDGGDSQPPERSSQES